ncbi:general stress protein 16O [Oxobacter pfennigii]|uniref:General stress protein 16O n=1 Tax=Oxobacter pfennigii TaxID=36849 RepID=A0A0N8NT68_9CLOT|nr:TraR/DksA C4-type zinc finger protein [Oxobacter pfennigii]KPU43992.1 general stress protein 16O [Oxobacter pfennigii]
MDKNKLQYFEDRLREEKEKEDLIIHKLNDDMGLDSSLKDQTSELSSYDNHPADIASETFEIEKNRALKANEVTHMRMIDNALEKIKNGTYGVCEKCKNNIDEERLDAIPYTNLCIHCERETEPNYKTYWQDRPIEETVMEYPFYDDDIDSEDYTGYDGEDVWQELESYNSVNYMLWDDDEDEDDQGIVEEIDRISNAQYKRQLPD